MRTLDLAVVVIYLAATVSLGAWFSARQRSIRDYFVVGRRAPWWAVMGSIVATETSTVTFISVPGFAFGADFTFLQLVFGYLLGRIAVSILFLPAYFRGELLTVYQLLDERFGVRMKRLASVLFLGTRSLADGFRLFATGLVLAALLQSTPAVLQAARTIAPDGDSTWILLSGSILVLGSITLVYTYLGGMSAVIWTDVSQLAVYVTGGVVAAIVLIDAIPGGWPEVIATGMAQEKFRLLDFTGDVTRSYTFWSGLIGGAFLSTATHGTDQMMVQRYFCSRSLSQARAALLGSGLIVLVQFALCLLIGVMLFVYYTVHAPAEMAAFTIDGRVHTDRVFPHFIVTHLSPGILGLVVAAVFAAAMSTLSSSLNSASAAAVNDFYVPATRGSLGDQHYLRVARRLTLAWGLLQVVVALVAVRLSRSVVDEVLGIASFTNGVVLGIFLLGTLTRRVDERSALFGVGAGVTAMLAVRLLTAVSWQWYVLIGATVTMTAGIAISRLSERAPPDSGRRHV